MPHKHDEDIKLLDLSIQDIYAKADAWTFEQHAHAMMRNGSIFPPPPQPDNVTREDISETTAKGSLFTPVNKKDKHPAVLYLHGGGYVIGHPDMTRRLGYIYAGECDMITFTPAYRLAPENPHPAQIEDAISALKWLAARPDVDTSKIVVGGVSAGGGIAANLAIAVRDDPSLPRIAALLLDIPYLGPTPTDPNVNPSFGKVFSRKSINLTNNWFTNGKIDDKTAFPLLATSLADFPPTIIGAAEFDILRDQAVQFATRLWTESTAGCELHVWKGTIHAGSSMAPSAQVHEDQRGAYIGFLKRCRII